MKSKSDVRIHRTLEFILEIGNACVGLSTNGAQSCTLRCGRNCILRGPQLLKRAGDVEAVGRVQLGGTAE